jgi:N-carbamoyl-L-amino-acid hydrolase
VTAWLDARGRSDASLADLVEAVLARAAARAEEDGTTVEVTAESTSPEVAFDEDAVRRISAIGGDSPWPVIPTAAGHDAGVLQAAGRRSAMLFVRNPTGVSHSPDEHAEMPDCLAGVEALAKVLARVAGGFTPERSLPADPLARDGWS